MLEVNRQRALKYFNNQLQATQNPSKKEYYQKQINNLNMNKNKITLLDGKEYDKKILLEQMEEDKFYYGVMDKLALSSSSLKLLLDSPKSFYYTKKYGSETTQAIRTGHLVHLAILEHEKYEQVKFVEVQSKNTKKYKDAVLEYGKDNVFTL